MTRPLKRRTFLLAAACLPFLPGCTFKSDQEQLASLFQAQLEKIEAGFEGRLGVFALNTNDGTTLRYRADERFPFCSTFKVLVASAVLKKSATRPELMQQRINYEKSDLVDYSPITEKHVGKGMSLAELCAAALQYSDNTATNLLLQFLGGPDALTAFARQIGDTEFRLDRWEVALNTCLPGDLRDTATPQSMGRSLQRVALGNVLTQADQKQLIAWLIGNTTGTTSIRAGVPASWVVGDKTGGGAYGTANDIAILWPPHHAPIIVSVYTTQRQKDAQVRKDLIARAAQVCVAWFEGQTTYRAA